MNQTSVISLRKNNLTGTLQSLFDAPPCESSELQCQDNISLLQLQVPYRQGGRI